MATEWIGGSGVYIAEVHGFQVKIVKEGRFKVEVAGQRVHEKGFQTLGEAKRWVELYSPKLIEERERLRRHDLEERERLRRHDLGPKPLTIGGKVVRSWGPFGGWH